MGKVDVLIIGGGIVGVCAAYYLQQNGRQVTLLERVEIGAGSSSGNAGQLVPSHIIPLAAPGVVSQALRWLLRTDTPFAIRTFPDFDLLIWLLRFALASREGPLHRAIPTLHALGEASARLTAELIAAEQLECHYQQDGMLMLYRTPEAFAAGTAEAHLFQEHGIPLTILEGSSVTALEPLARPDLCGGIHFSGDASLNPALYLQQLSERVQTKGAMLHTNTAVLGFQTTDKRITQVKTNHGIFQPDQVVLAAGVWSRPLAKQLRLNLPVQPARGYSLTLQHPAAGPRRALQFAERRMAVTPMGSLLRCTGRLELSGINSTVDPRQIVSLQEALRDYLQGPFAPTPLEMWAGLRPATPDGLPIIGRAPGLENLIVATGHGMLGVSLAAVTGQLVAEMVCGRPTAIDVTPLRVGR